MAYLGKSYQFNIRLFHDIVFGKEKLQISQTVQKRLEDTRRFINHLLKENIKVYGITTGFGDLRDHFVGPEKADQLSQNLIESHDAGIGSSFSLEITLGAMASRASSLAKGHSGIRSESLNTLLQMINHRIVPQIPRSGSLGASGDLCMLSRLARAMQGKEVPVWYNGSVMTAKDALNQAGILPFKPEAKEGLAMINGTSFMSSMIAIAFLQEIHELENILGMQGLFFNAVGAIDAAFNESIQNIRLQAGQKLVAQILLSHFKYSDMTDFTGMQDDYCIRCIPQIFGPKIEIILEQYTKIERELNAVTDNPLFFKGDEISIDVSQSRKLVFEGEDWCVLSGGNFHGECITTIADTISAANAKLAITLERQIGYMLNPHRNNNKLPIYLIPKKEEIGLSSGYMITQYTANSLTQKICQLGSPTSIFNITSSNETEDIVSYGASAAERLLEQLNYLKQLNTIYLTVAIQAYSITRQQRLTSKNKINPNLLAEKIFQKFQDFGQDNYPIISDSNFEKRYEQAKAMLSSNQLRAIMNYPLYTSMQNNYSALLAQPSSQKKRSIKIKAKT